MSFADAFLNQAPEGYHLPKPLRQAFDFLEARGHGEVFAEPGELATSPRPSSDLSSGGDEHSAGFLAVSTDPSVGTVFYTDFDLSGYLEAESPEADKVVSIADPDGGGARIVAWAGPEGTSEYRYCLLGAEGEGPFLVANNTIDLLRLIAVGYAWIGEDTLGRTPAEAHADDRAGTAEFRFWVEETFGEKVPDYWPAAQLDEGLASFLVELRGGDDEGRYLDGLVPEPGDEDVAADAGDAAGQVGPEE